MNRKATIAHTIGMILFSAILMIGSNMSASAQDTLSVALKSGRTFSGEVDARTDDSRLWLRYGRGSTTILRPINWDRIVQARHNGAEVPAANVQQVAESIQSAEPPKVYFQNGGQSTSDAGSSMAARAKNELVSTPRVKSIRVDAHLGNWDGDVETDGLVVHICPSTADGALAKVNGTVHASLTAPRFEQPRHSVHSRAIIPGNLGRWTKSISSNDFDAEGIRLELPFQSIHPEFDTNVGPGGLLHVKVVIPGHGVFERSIDSVRIRPFAPLRDARQRAGQSRSLPMESSGRN